jgi:hypothetical protein
VAFGVHAKITSSEVRPYGSPEINSHNRRAMVGALPGAGTDGSVPAVAAESGDTVITVSK